MSTNHNLFLRERTAEAESSRGPSAYQPNALPLGQTGSHCRHKFPAALVVSRRSFACEADHITFAARHNVVKDNAENSVCVCARARACVRACVCVCVVVMMIVLNQFLPLALSRLTIGRLLQKVNKSSQESASTSENIPARQLQSASDTRTFVIPRVNTNTFGERTSSYASPSAWNNLPQTLWLFLHFCF